MGGASGVAVFGAILTSRLAANLAKIPAAHGRVDAASIQSGPGAIAALPAELRGDVVDAFARSSHVVFLWGVPLAAIAFGVVIFLKELPLRESAHVGFDAIAEAAGLAVEPAFPAEFVPEYHADPPAPEPPRGW